MRKVSVIHMSSTMLYLLINLLAIAVLSATAFSNLLRCRESLHKDGGNRAQINGQMVRLVMH
jgi:hypothetical protein